MKRLLFLILFLHTTLVFSQERYDDYMFVRMMETDAVDLKCQIFPCERYDDPMYSWDMLKIEIPRLIESGRYIISISFTKFGVIVLHKENSEQIKQVFKLTFLDKQIKEMFKNGYSLKYLNDDGGYGLYELNPKVTKQVILKRTYNQEKDQKKTAKLIAKGLYIVGIRHSYLVLQNGRDDLVDQVLESVPFGNFYDRIEARRSQGYIASPMFAYYSNIGTSYLDRVEIVFDKPSDGNVKGENVAMIRTQEEFVNYLSQNVKPGYSIDMTWCGWDGETGRSKRVEWEDYDSSTNIWDVLTGLTGIVTNLIVGPNGSTAAGGNTDYDSHSGDGHSHSGNSISDRCSLCQGSGKCSPRSYSNRKSACSGSGLCGYCNGAGWIGSGDNRAVCTACNGDKKCKTCHGTGKCQQCNGTGRK